MDPYGVAAALIAVGVVLVAIGWIGFKLEQRAAEQSRWPFEDDSVDERPAFAGPPPEQLHYTLRGHHPAKLLGPHRRFEHLHGAVERGVDRARPGPL